MKNLFEEMEEDQADASKINEINTEGLKTVAELATAVAGQTRVVKQFEADLKEAKQKLLKLTDEDLPALLQEIGLPKFELDDGTKVTLQQTYGAHISEANQPEAFGWLREHGFEDIIKNTVACEFGKGEDSEAVKFMELAQSEGVPVLQKTSVHPQTLKAFVRERVEAGDDFPMRTFGAFIGQRAIIKFQASK